MNPNTPRRESPSRRTRAILYLVAGSLSLAVSAPGNSLIADGEIVAVAAKASDDYVRSKLPDGSFQPETYAFGQGGYWAGDVSDKSIDRIKFMDIARIIAGPLQGQSYLATHDPKAAKLLIMVYWGTTIGGRENPAASFDPKLAPDGATLDQFSARVAPLLGYETALADAVRLRGTGLKFLSADVFEDLEYNRYFIVLMAYDFQLLWKEKKHKLLWETRFSINEHHNEFDQQLAPMVQAAAKYFGKDSHGLIHREQSGHVDLGELKILGVVPEPEKK